MFNLLSSVSSVFFSFVMFEETSLMICFQIDRLTDWLPYGVREYREGAQILGPLERNRLNMFQSMFSFHCYIFFVVCIRSSKSAVFIISLSPIFHPIDDILIFQEDFQIPFFDAGQFSSVTWRIGVFQGKFQIFLNSSICCSVVAPLYGSTCHNFCFTELQCTKKEVFH